MTYESPTITELGSVEAFTRGDLFADGSDGVVWFLEPFFGDASS